MQDLDGLMAEEEEGVQEVEMRMYSKDREATEKSTGKQRWKDCLSSHCKTISLVINE